MIQNSGISDYRSELERRIGQFMSALKSMHHRAIVEVSTSCYMIFEDQLHDDSVRAVLHESAKPSAALIATAFEDAGIRSITIENEIDAYHLPVDGWMSDDSQLRFVQFSFEEKWFCLDMPLQTLYRDEAERIMQSRNGFFYLKDRPEFTLYGEDVDGYDPFRKVYIYGDEDSAAEDMAYIFFQLWRYPVDWCFYVTASSFRRDEGWEDSSPME